MFFPPLLLLFVDVTMKERLFLISVSRVTESSMTKQCSGWVWIKRITKRFIGWIAAMEDATAKSKILLLTTTAVGVGTISVAISRYEFRLSFPKYPLKIGLFLYCDQMPYIYRWDPVPSDNSGEAHGIFVGFPMSLARVGFRQAECVVWIGLDESCLQCINTEGKPYRSTIACDSNFGQYVIRNEHP